MPYKVEKNIPLPNKRQGCLLVYPFADMEIGDSFIVPLEKHGPIRAAVRNETKKTGRKYTTRKLKDGIRVWRIS